MTKHTRRIRIVDDDAGVLKSLSALLRAHGYRTLTFGSAEEFLADPDAARGAALLLDVRMPGMSGLELQAALAKRGVELPIVFMTGHGDIPMAIEAIRAGAVDFIEKPFTDAVLLAALTRALGEGGEAETKAALDRPADEQIACLTARERDVFEHLVLGQTNKIIAHELGISQRTVEVHRGRIKDKLKARSLADLIRLKQAASG
jgi:two-component system response regulator FixJ